MKIYNEIDLIEHEPWGGAEWLFNRLTDSEMQTVQAVIEEIYPDGLTSTQLNDILWFDDEIIITEWLESSVDEFFQRAYIAGDGSIVYKDGRRVKTK